MKTYIAAVAVPVAPTAQDIAADISPARWQPLGQFPDEPSAKAAVQTFIATYDHDAYFISANPDHPLYQRAMQRLARNAGGAA